MNHNKRRNSGPFFRSSNDFTLLHTCRCSGRRHRLPSFEHTDRLCAARYHFRNLRNSPWCARYLRASQEPLARTNPSDCSKHADRSACTALCLPHSGSTLVSDGNRRRRRSYFLLSLRRSTAWSASSVPAENLRQRGNDIPETRDSRPLTGHAQEARVRHQ